MSATCYHRIGIAGGGLLGRLLAWQLQRRGHRVSLFEAGSFSTPAAAGYTAAGMISPLSEAVAGEPWLYPAGLAALLQWPLLLAALAADSGQRVAWQQRGSLLVAHPQDQAELQQFRRDALRAAPGAFLQALNGAAIATLEPALSPHLQQGLLVPAEGHIDNRHLLEVLLHTCQRLGVVLAEHTEVSVAPGLIHTANLPHHFDLVLDCRGTGAKPQWSQVRGVRGEVMRVHAPDMQLQRPVRLLHPRYQLYVVPKPGQQFVIGATQLESEDRSPISLQSMLELGSALYTLSPAFAEARIIEQSTNLRPALPDNRPQILWEEGLIRINGLFRHGYLLAPMLIDHLLRYLPEYKQRHIPEHAHPLPFVPLTAPLTPSVLPPTQPTDISAQEPLPYV